MLPNELEVQVLRDESFMIAQHGTCGHDIEHRFQMSISRYYEYDTRHHGFRDDCHVDAHDTLMLAAFLNVLLLDRRL